MCTEDQHKEKMSALAGIEKKLDTLIKGRTPQVKMVAISATTAYTLDYMGRKHLYMFSTTPLILDLKSLGNFTVPQNTWVNIGFQEGLSIFALGQASTVYVTVKATDEVVP